MTDSTQELGELLREHRGRILTYDELYRKQHHSNHRRIVDFEHADAVIKQSLLDWHNKQIEAVLNRLESRAAYDPSGTSPLINPREIEAERNKLMESK